jgi:ABC-type lipoprotein release transport system permease subunit
MVSIFRQDRSREAGPLSPDDYRSLENTPGLFEWLGAARIEPGQAVIDGRPGIATVAAVTPSLAGALAFPLRAGAVISHRAWKNAFDGRANALGSDIRIDKGDFKITGVAPDRLDGLYSDQSVDLWVSVKERDLEGENRKQRDLWVLAYLRPHVSPRQAQTALRSGSAGLGEVSVTPFTGLAPDMARGLARVRIFLRFSACAVFFIACINVASFLLGRALKRSHETSLRIALGATRSELLQDLFADSVVISLAGGAMGLLLGIMTARALPVFLFAEDAERLSFATHLLPILTASTLCIVITVICGMMPVLGTVTDRPWIVLQRETGSPSLAIQRLRSCLVIGQITACCMLVICTALLLAGLHSAMETSAGHRLGDPVLLTVQGPQPDGPEVDIGYFSKAEQKAKSVAGLSPLAWTAELPGSQPRWRSFRIQPSSHEYRNAVMDIAWLTPDTLKLLDPEPIAGRMFGLDDQGHKVAVVDEAAAAELFGLQTVGSLIRDASDQPIEIIGVVRKKSGDAKAKRRPTIYYGYLEQSNAPAPIRNAQFHVPLVPPQAGVELNANVVSAGYFAALDMPLIAGRIFPDNRIAGQDHIAVINQEAADLYFNGKPLGAGIIDDSGVRTEIVGIVKSQAFGTFEQHAEPAIYFPMWQGPPPLMTLILKHSRWNRGMETDLRHKVEMVPGRGPAPVAISTLDRQLAQTGLAALRIATLIGSASAAIALILSILGLLSAQTDAERQRRNERALRFALGARRWHIVFLVMKNAVRLAFIGAVIGALLSFELSRLLAADIPLVSSPPFQVWLIAPLLPVLVITIASMLPALRASVISPSTILRDS